MIVLLHLLKIIREIFLIREQESIGQTFVDKGHIDMCELNFFLKVLFKKKPTINELLFEIIDDDFCGFLNLEVNIQQLLVLNEKF